jgi:OmpA-OmpF porin, OOP family
MGKTKGEFSMNKRLAVVLGLFAVVALSLTGCASSSGVIAAVDTGCKTPVVAAAKPATPAVATAAPAPKSEIIYFDFDKSIIKSTEQPKIDKIVGWMKADPKAAAIVIGYTDPIGTDQYNMGLSKKRAESVKASLVKAGVPADKVVLEWKGETNLAKPGLKGIGPNAPNRRAEVSVTVK